MSKLGEIPEGSPYVSPFARCNPQSAIPHQNISPGRLQKSPTAPNVSAKALLHSTGPNSAKSDVIKSLYTTAKGPSGKKLESNGTSSGIPVVHRPSMPPPKIPVSTSKTSSLASGSQDSLLYMVAPGGTRNGTRSPTTEDLVKKMRVVWKLKKKFH